ncbi:hypothetical protein Btru_051340 [Bulinus truncatus]|nr:hypothetical protein Btru_051340 [Bulinus truncatus]
MYSFCLHWEIQSKLNEVYFTDDLVPVILNDEEIKKDAVNKHVRNITLLQDGFKVLQKGVYYIYSSIHFHVGPGMPCSNLKYKVWQHHIERKGNNAIVTLFKTSHTCCNDCNMNEETSYTGGTVKLFAGDIIKIKISGHGLAFYDGNSSFAGMIMTGEED